VQSPKYNRIPTNKVSQTNPQRRVAAAINVGDPVGDAMIPFPSPITEKLPNLPEANRADQFKTRP
jgi:hypothetical protein